MARKHTYLASGVAKKIVKLARQHLSIAASGNGSERVRQRHHRNNQIIERQYGGVA